MLHEQVVEMKIRRRVRFGEIMGDTDEDDCDCDCNHNDSDMDE